jgi:threonyl-tRNA synthetase
VLTADRDAGVRVVRRRAATTACRPRSRSADEKVPYMLIVGPRDAESGSVSVRARGEEKDLGAMPLD